MSDNEDLKMETKPAMGQPHAGGCWGNWDVKASECKACSIADRCSELTKRMLAKAQGQVAAPVVVKGKAASAKSVAPAVKPPETAKAEPVKPAAKKEEAKSETVKEESSTIPLEPLVAAIKKHLAKDVVLEVKDGEKATLCFFKNKDGNAVFKAGVFKDGSFVRLVGKNGDRMLDAGYDAAELDEAIKALCC